MTPVNRTALRRLRILQYLAVAAPAPMAAQLLLRVLADDADLEPTLTRVLLSLVWLEDRGLADVRTYDADGPEPVALATITPAGVDYLVAADDPQIPGIVHPSRLLGGA